MISALQINTAAQDKAVPLQHPTHHDVTSVSVDAKGSASQVTCDLCGVVDDGGRESTAAPRDRNCHAVDGDVIAPISRAPRTVKNAIVVGFSIRDQHEGACDLAIDLDDVRAIM